MLCQLSYASRCGRKPPRWGREEYSLAGGRASNKEAEAVPGLSVGAVPGLSVGAPAPTGAVVEGGLNGAGEWTHKLEPRKAHARPGADGR